MKGNGDIVFLLRDVIDCMLEGCVLQFWILACDSRALMVMAGSGSWLNFSCIFALEVMF